MHGISRQRYKKTISNYEIIDRLVKKLTGRKKYLCELHYAKANSDDPVPSSFFPEMHIDDDGVLPGKVLTILFYIEKTCLGGNFIYETNETNDEKVAIVESGTVLIFKGNLKHRPQKIWGHGERKMFSCSLKDNTR